jgi:hypothetical protein
MFKQFLLISSISFVIAGCGPAPAQLTSTALAMEALTETAVPTVTPVPTFTPTPTLTPTIMPSPTPVGGGNGTLVFFATEF